MQRKHTRTRAHKYTHTNTHAHTRTYTHRALFAKSVRTVSLPGLGSRLAALPSPLISGAFGSLASLNLAGSTLADLPQGVSALTKLAKLNLSRCELAEVPPAIGGLTSLIDLDLSRNK